MTEDHDADGDVGDCMIEMPNEDPQRTKYGLKDFLRAQPEALGTVQIMIGVVTFLMLGYTYVLGHVQVAEGIILWAPVFFILSGAVTIAAKSKLKPYMVRTALATNICSSIVAVLALGFLIILGLETWESNTYVLISLYFLQFCVSVCISQFTCMAHTSPEKPEAADIIYEKVNSPTYDPPPYSEKVPGHLSQCWRSSQTYFPFLHMSMQNVDPTLLSFLSFFPEHDVYKNLHSSL